MRSFTKHWKSISLDCYNTHFCIQGASLLINGVLYIFVFHIFNWFVWWWAPQMMLKIVMRIEVQYSSHILNSLRHFTISKFLSLLVYYDILWTALTLYRWIMTLTCFQALWISCWHVQLGNKDLMSYWMALPRSYF